MKRSSLRVNPAVLMTSVFGMADQAPREALPEVPRVRATRKWRGDHARERARRCRQIERGFLRVAGDTDHG